jgi:hypothetical protein
MTDILAALVGGKFKRFEEEDRSAFMDAGDDAMIWHPKQEVAVIVCTTTDGELIVEVYDWDGDAKQGVLRLADV